MIVENISPIKTPACALLPGPKNPPRRILVVEDEPCILHLNTKALLEAGYQVDAAADGAAAWDALQRNRYDLVVTDNNMPKVSGVELIQKIHEAALALPVIMATGTLPQNEFDLCPWLRPAAVLQKPYTFTELLGTVKTLLQTTAPIVLFWFLTAAGHAQEAKPALETSLQSADNADKPNAMTTSVLGKCEYSEDGVTFAQLESGYILGQGAIVRTGKDGQADLFFRRTGTTVRLQAGAEIKLEKMTYAIKDTLPVAHTLLDLRQGRIFIAVRSTVAGSTLEIRNAAGRAVVEGSGVGRYIITADGTHVTAKDSLIPLKVIGENGITIVAAGQQFAGKDGKMFEVAAPLLVQDLIQMDELKAGMDKPAAPEPSPKP
jgi:DNA-binding response OmpR family regulator